MGHLILPLNLMFTFYSNWPYQPDVLAKKPAENGTEHSTEKGTEKRTENGSENGTENVGKSPPTTTQAIIFGLGSMFNHSTRYQNVGWERDLKNKVITYLTLRDIKEGEELCISYGQRLTFKDSDEMDIEGEKDVDDWTDVLNIIELID